MNLLQEWAQYACQFAAAPEDLYSGCRKILRHRVVKFKHWDDSIQLSDAGYTSNKMRMLEKNYLHEESRAMAIKLWNLRREKAKYGSVSFTTFNHFVKGKGTLSQILERKSKRASVFGPCIQSVCITWVDKKNVSIDIAYRTTEWFKKFPADLVFIRDVLLEPFNFKGMTPTVTFYFANITAHPMYWVTVIPHLPHPLYQMDEIKKRDKYFFDWMVKWSARYVCKKYFRGIQKFAQAMRVRKDALERIDKVVIKNLVRYFEKHHPGYRNDYVAPEEEE